MIFCTYAAGFGPPSHGSNYMSLLDEAHEQVVVVDEADECWRHHRPALSACLAAACAAPPLPASAAHLSWNPDAGLDAAAAASSADAGVRSRQTGSATRRERAEHATHAVDQVAPGAQDDADRDAQYDSVDFEDALDPTLRKRPPATTMQDHPSHPTTRGAAHSQHESLAKTEQELADIIVQQQQARDDRPTFVYAGATLDGSVAEELRQQRWLQYPVEVHGAAKTALPPGLTHRCALKKCCNDVAHILRSTVVAMCCGGAQHHEDSTAVGPKALARRLAVLPRFCVIAPRIALPVSSDSCIGSTANWAGPLVPVRASSCRLCARIHSVFSRSCMFLTCVCWLPRRRVREVREG